MKHSKIEINNCQNMQVLKFKIVKALAKEMFPHLFYTIDHTYKDKFDYHS